MNVGQEVRIASVPKEWMQPLVGQTGAVGEIRHNEHVDAYRVDDIPQGPMWFTAKHLEAVVAQEQGEAS